MASELTYLQQNDTADYAHHFRTSDRRVRSRSYTHLSQVIPCGHLIRVCQVSCGFMFHLVPWPPLETRTTVCEAPTSDRLCHRQQRCEADQASSISALQPHTPQFRPRGKGETCTAATSPRTASQAPARRHLHWQSNNGPHLFSARLPAFPI
jgi:hypothetical protein